MHLQYEQVDLKKILMNLSEADEGFEVVVVMKKNHGKFIEL